MSASLLIDEVLLGGLFALSYLLLGLTLGLLCILIALAALQGIVRYDLAHTVIPWEFLAPFLLAALGYALVQGAESLPYTLGWAAGIAALLALIHFASRGRAMGLADAPLAFGLALVAGPAAFSGLILSFWVGAAVGIIILAKTPKGHRIGIEVPFAPFLAAGFLIAFYTGWDPFAFIASLLAPVLA